MTTKHQKTVSAPIMEFVHAGEVVSTLNVVVTINDEGIFYSFVSVPATRVGRTLPDWPQALSLRPDLAARKN